MLKLEDFLLEEYDDTDVKHRILKNRIIKMKDSKLISEDINRYIRRNIELGKTDHITATYVVIKDNDYIGLAFVNYHPDKVDNNRFYPEEIEVGLGLLEEFRGNSLGSLLEQELSEKLLSIYPQFDLITARVGKENIASIKSGEKAGFEWANGDEYHYKRK